MRITAGCKINIGLDVLRRRPDGYHDIETVMFPVRELCDIVTVEPNGESCDRMFVEGLQVDCPASDNICMRACECVRARFGIPFVDIVLDKRIPFGAGLGGGSSDGVAVIKALDEIFGLRLSYDRLTDIAAELGSDTVFFVRNTPQICRGRGEIVEPVDLDLSGLTLVIAKPAESVSTREAYAGITPRIPERPLQERLAAGIGEWPQLIENDFEKSVFASHPDIHTLKTALYRQGALYASMSGSGSAVFALFDRPVVFAPPFDGLFVHSETI